MRLFTKATLRNFWRIYPDSKPALEFWYETIEKTTFRTPNGIIMHFNNADIVGNNRIVFNITQNKYRLIVKFEYERHLAFVRFIGTHKEYDKITNIQNI
jgi:mRNA interferase HigB